MAGCRGKEPKGAGHEKNEQESAGKGKTGAGGHNERNILKDCASPFIDPFVGSFQTSTHIYILMEYMIGGKLYTYTKLSGTVDNNAAKFYAAKVVLMLEYLHGKKIIFRDLKPKKSANRFHGTFAIDRLWIREVFE